MANASNNLIQPLKILSDNCYETNSIAHRWYFEFLRYPCWAPLEFRYPRAERIIEFRFWESLGLCNTPPRLCNPALSECYDQMVFVQISEFIFLNSQTYFSKLSNVFLQRIPLSFPAQLWVSVQYRGFVLDDCPTQQVATDLLIWIFWFANSDFLIC